MGKGPEPFPPPPPPPQRTCLSPLLSSTTAGAAVFCGMPTMQHFILTADAIHNSLVLTREWQACCVWQSLQMVGCTLCCKCSIAAVGCMLGIEASSGVPALTRCKPCGLQKHAELVEAYGVRAAAATDYLRLVRPALDVHTAQLHDAKVRRPVRSSDQSSSCREAVKVAC